MSSLGWERSAKQIFQEEKVPWDDEEGELLRKEKCSQITGKKRLKKRKVLEKEGKNIVLNATSKSKDSSVFPDLSLPLCSSWKYFLHDPVFWRFSFGAPNLDFSN